jgi:hypothetical protein
MANKRLLSWHADQIWAHNAQLHHDTDIASSSEQKTQDATVVAVQPGCGSQSNNRSSMPQQGNWRGRGAQGTTGSGQYRSGGAQPAVATPMLLTKHPLACVTLTGDMAN